MNAQSNHPIRTSTTRTTDPQFLGPEAGQQAGGETHTRSELDANGSELHRYFSVARGALISVRSNGVTLCRQVDDEWKVLSRKKGDVPLAQWVVNKQAALTRCRCAWLSSLPAVPRVSCLKPKQP